MSEINGNENIEETVEEIETQETVEEVETPEQTGQTIPYSRFKQKVDEVNDLKSQLSEVKEQMKKYVPPEKITELEGEFEKRLNDIKLKSEVGLKLIEAKVEYPDLVLEKINYKNMTVTDNGILGVVEEVNRVKTIYPKLFGNAQSTTTPTLSTQTQQTVERKSINSFEDMARNILKK